MAQGIISNVVGEILIKLSSQVSQELGMLCGVKDDLTKLTSSVSAIKALFLDAEECQTKSHSLKDWLEKLKEALYDADDVLDEFFCETLRREVMTRGNKAKQVRVFFSRSNQVAFDYRMARKIRNVRERLDVIAAEKRKFHLIGNFEHTTQYGSFDQIRMRADTYSRLNEEEVIGRDDDMKVVKDLLLHTKIKDNNISFIAIVGMGGIGKTTLARSLFNDKEVSDYFDLKMWVCVFDQFDVKLVVKKIIESATNNSPNVQGMEALQSKLHKVIQGKKYLLVMDDIWNESEEKWFHLKNLLIDGAKGSKIIITKRDSILAAEIANMTSLFTLKGLSESNCWSLFRKVAFKEDRESTNMNLVKLGKEISVKCRGVPLVVRHIGRLLYFKTSEEEWMSFKNNDLLEVIQQENDMTSILKLSYNHLPPNLKQCFAYTSLFSKDDAIRKDELIQQWVAQGFVKSSNGSKTIEDVGNEYFMELCWRFLYEQSGESISCEVYMHDLMRNLARMVGKHEHVHGNSKYDYVGKRTRHVSFDPKIESWREFLPKLRKAQGLRTFLLPYNPYERKEINKAALDELFSNCSRLRVLDLKYSNIDVVPDSIKNLRHLRYLDLSGNETMKLLPNSITKLHNLETLNLKVCYALKALPRDTSDLVNLRHLDISGPNQLTHMPKGMGKLTCLQTLGLFVLDNNNKHGSKLKEFNGLNHLRGRLYIRGLEQLRCTPSEATLANLKDKKRLRNLTLEWKLSRESDEYKATQDGFNDEIILEALQPHPNVECFGLCGYGGVGLPNWVSNSLLKLTDISLFRCYSLQHLPQLNHLPALKYLFLMDITPLKFIDKNDPCSSSVFFPSLEKLHLINMPNLEGWWEGEMEKQAGLLPTFPRLTSLLISSCPKLASMPGHPS